MSGKHVDGCDHTGGFHDGLYELCSGIRLAADAKVTVPTEQDLATVLEQDEYIAAGASDAAHIIEKSRPKVEDLYAQLNEVRARDYDCNSADGKAMASPTTPGGDLRATACPGCMYDTTAEPVFGDPDTLAEIQSFGDDTRVQMAGGRRGWKAKPKRTRSSRVKEMVSKVLHGCGRKVASLGHRRKNK